MLICANTIQQSSVKHKYCKERIESKVGICLIKVRINILDYWLIVDTT